MALWVNDVILGCDRRNNVLTTKSKVMSVFLKFWFLGILCVCYGMRTFDIDYENNTFLKDGKPFHYVSGSIHYARVPHYYWKDRLDKMYAAGLDAAQIYIPWNVHEPSSGKYDFSGQQDLVQFLKQVQASGLLAIVRAGPYICAEWEFGGFPSWILAKNGSIAVRTMDPGYIGPVDRWLSVLLPKLKSLLYVNGGPIIMIQVENEYGNYYACDHTYTLHLRDTFRKYVGEKVILFTTDGNVEHDLKCGAIKGTYATVDFGPGNVTAAFAPMRQWNPKGPLVNSEFYTGWLDYWGHNHSHYDILAVTKSLDEILKMKANVNMYMFEGGTNFGYMNGADPPFNTCPTSYDYDAPLSEAGDITQKYMAVRETIAKYKELPQVPIPPTLPKYAYGQVQMTFFGLVVDHLSAIASTKPVKSVYPLSMEEVGQDYGFILYRTVLNTSSNGGTLSIKGLRDRAHILLSTKPQGILDRNGKTQMNLKWTRGQTLDVFVENQGRINYGTLNYNRKGIISNVTLGSTNTMLKNWKIYSINFTKLFETHMKLRPGVYELPNYRTPAPYLPSVFYGSFVLPDKANLPADSFLKLDGWSKGQAFINGVNVGRYWPAKGPQITLYVPYQVFRKYPHLNVIIIVELDYLKKPCDNFSTCKVEFVDTPIINGTVHNTKRFNNVNTIEAVPIL